jgi:hypothetical protein
MLKNCVVLFAVLAMSGLASANFVNGPIVAPINDPSHGFTLQEVIDAGGIRVGDKVFDLFTVNNSKSDGAQAPDPSGIVVYGVQVSGELGLRFTGGWSAVGGQVADSVIMFRVQADRPWLISDNSLWMDAYGARNGGQVSISENVFAADPLTGFTPSLADKFVYFANRGDNQKYDHQEFTNAQGELVALPVIWVVKDIVVSGGPRESGGAGLSQFYQTFSQIPEPASMMLLVVGGLLASVRKHRRS